MIGNRWGYKRSKNHPDYDPEAEQALATKSKIAKNRKKPTTASTVIDQTSDSIVYQTLQQTNETSLSIKRSETPNQLNNSPRKSPKFPPPPSIIIPERSASDIKRTDSEPRFATVRKIEVKPEDDEEAVALKRCMACITCVKLLRVIVKVLSFTAITLNVMTVISTEVVKLLVNICSARELSSTSLNTQSENCYNSNAIWKAAFYMNAFILGAVGFCCFRSASREQIERAV